MISFDSFTLQNGLRVIVHRDETTPLAAFNLLYDVGSRDESPEKTGFAHLFEHLMFGGTTNVPNFDQPLQRVGAENNAFTSPDITNYYTLLPAENLETAFWLESDRMLTLSFDPQVLEVQRKVVIEEFKQRYLNQPYGDLWLKLRPLAYKTHPYRWATIGKEIRHIEEATMEDVKDFFFRFYRPNNAVLVVAGNVKTAEVERLAKKWFGDIEASDLAPRSLPQEAAQTEARTFDAQGDVPLEQLTLAFPMVEQTHEDYTATDLVSDILGRDESALLYRRLVNEEEVFQSMDAYITGSMDPGLLVLSGRVREGVQLEEAYQKLKSELRVFRDTPTEASELEKVKNQAEAARTFSEVNLLNRAIQLAYGTVLGNTNLVNEQQARIQAVSGEQIERLKQSVLADTQENALFYRKKD
ncbi:MAG: pitrilysin family protein [Bacteroidota bacterium]